MIDSAGGIMVSDSKGKPIALFFIWILNLISKLLVHLNAGETNDEKYFF